MALKIVLDSERCIYIPFDYCKVVSSYNEGNVEGTFDVLKEMLEFASFIYIRASYTSSEKCNDSLKVFAATDSAIKEFFRNSVKKSFFTKGKYLLICGRVHVKEMVEYRSSHLTAKCFKKGTRGIFELVNHGHLNLAREGKIKIHAKVVMFFFTRD